MILLYPLPRPVSLVMVSVILGDEFCISASAMVRPPVSLSAVNPSDVAILSYVFDERVVVDLFLQVGWRSSTGVWGPVALSLEDVHNHTEMREVQERTR